MRRDVFQAIADPTRRDIIALIAKKPMTPNAVTESFDVSRQAISKHIQIKKSQNLSKIPKNILLAGQVRSRNSALRQMVGRYGV